MTIIRTVDDLERIYGDFGVVGEASTARVADHVTPQYRRYIEAAPFVALATSGPEELDCAPRRDLPGFVRVQDPKTLLLPDRRGNNRIDSLRPATGFVPGTAERATVRLDERWRANLELKGLSAMVPASRTERPINSRGVLPRRLA